MLTEPLWRGVSLGLVTELLQPPRPPSLLDESIGSFISRRFGPHMANNIVSAVLHGIYAGDVWQLSMKSIQPLVWFLEQRHQSISNAMIDRWKTKTEYIPQSDVELTRELSAKSSTRSMRPIIEGASVYTFKRGLGQLADQLQARLRKSKNVAFRMSTPISRIKFNEESGGLSVSTFPRLN